MSKEKDKKGGDSIVIYREDKGIKFHKIKTKCKETTKIINTSLCSHKEKSASESSQGHEEGGSS